MSDEERAVMHVLWPMLNQLQWSESQLNERLDKIAEIEAWLPQCEDRTIRGYYQKWLNFFRDDAGRKRAEMQQSARASNLNIPRPR